MPRMAHDVIKLVKVLFGNLLRSRIDLDAMRFANLLTSRVRFFTDVISASTG